MNKILYYVWVGPAMPPFDLVSIVKQNIRDARTHGWQVRIVFDPVNTRLMTVLRNWIGIELFNVNDVIFNARLTPDLAPSNSECIHCVDVYGTLCQMNEWASASDIIRLIVLYFTGGVYFDWDVISYSRASQCGTLPKDSFWGVDWEDIKNDSNFTGSFLRFDQGNDVLIALDPCHVKIKEILTSLTVNQLETIQTSWNNISNFMHNHSFDPQDLRRKDRSYCLENFKTNGATVSEFLDKLSEEETTQLYAHENHKCSHARNIMALAGPLKIGPAAMDFNSCVGRKLGAFFNRGSFVNMQKRGSTWSSTLNQLKSYHNQFSASRHIISLHLRRWIREKRMREKGETN